LATFPAQSSIFTAAFGTRFGTHLSFGFWNGKQLDNLEALSVISRDLSGHLWNLN
jgi:hypothetical protein